MIDTHCHLNYFTEGEGELEKVINRAWEGGISHLITVGTNPSDWCVHRSIADSFSERIFFTLGLHPCYVGKNWFLDLEKLSKQFESVKNRPLAVGEIGLDFYRLPEYPEEADRIKKDQIGAFVQQLNLAKKWNLPVIVHSREAFNLCIDLIKEVNFSWDRVIFHCFVEGIQSIRFLMDQGAWVSFTGILTYPSASYLTEVVRFQELNRLILETDAPYLAPCPHRGKRCEPSFLKHVACYCADIFEVSFEEIDEVSTLNSQNFFLLK